MQMNCSAHTTTLQSIKINFIKAIFLFTTKEIATTKASGIILGWELSMKS